MRASYKCVGSTHRAVSLRESHPCAVGQNPQRFAHAAGFRERVISKADTPNSRILFRVSEKDADNPQSASEESDDVAREEREELNEGVNPPAAPAPARFNMAAVLFGGAVLALGARWAVDAYRTRLASEQPPAVAPPADRAHDVKLALYTQTDRPLEPLQDNQALGPSTRVVGTVRAMRSAPTHVLAFASDANGGLHWFDAARDASAHDLGSWPVLPSTQEVPFPASLDVRGLPAGPLRIVVLVSDARIAYADVETLPAGDRIAPVLNKRFGADAREWVVRVAP